MEELIVMVVLGVVVVAGVLPILALIFGVRAGRKVETLERRLADLERKFLRSQTSRTPEGEKAPDTAPSDEPSAVGEVLKKRKETAESAVPRVPEPAVQPTPEPAAAPPPIIQPASVPVAKAATTEPPAPPRWHIPKLKKPINWEQFMGVKLFAWIGGLALFLAVVFFVKYSFEHNLVPPELRVASGFLAGVGLLVGGVVLKRKDYAVTAQTLISTGVLILYASSFAAHGFYHFAFFGVIPTFLLMTLITATAFVLAVRLDAMVVAVLGMLGGFLTPVLLSTGVDSPLGLFSYIALLNVGLLAVALNRRWHFLVALSALGTGFMQIGWTAEFFRSELYYEGNKVLITMTVLLGFGLLYLGGTWLANKRSQSNWWFSGATLALLAVAMMFTAYFLTFQTLGERPALLFSYLFLVDAAVLGLVWQDRRVSPAHPLAGVGVFLLLAGWTMAYLDEQLLHVALLFYLLFAVAHTVTPILLNKLRPDSMSPVWSQGFPSLALLLVVVPILQLTEVSFLVWPFVLLVDVLAIGLAVLSLSLLPVLVVMLLTLIVTGAALTKIPVTFEGFPLWLTVLGFFSVVFVSVGVFFARRLQAADGTGPELKRGWLAWGNNQLMAAQLPAMSAALPFLLLILAVARLPLRNPTPVFALALLLVILVLGVTRLFRLRWMCAIGLACTVALQTIWQGNRLDPEHAFVPLLWHLVFFGVFAAYPFVFRRDFVNRLEPWVVAALSGPLHFFLVHKLVKVAYPNQIMGVIPLLFAVPALVSLGLALKHWPADSPKRMTTLAWFGGVALFFITLIFPIQFDRQWITIGWALEGVALLWLFHRIPHNGLRLVGSALLIAAFVRLALNPAVLEYHARTATALFNWYLYAYGIVSVCLFAAARLVQPPRHKLYRINLPPVFLTLGTILAFLLVNVEIADYFTEEGARALTFKFSGNFARDMTYTIAWSMFAFGLLVVGIIKKLPAARWSAIGLLGAAILKLFFHDLAQLEALYRIGAFVAVALIAIGASFAYQRYFAAVSKTAAARLAEPSEE